MFKCNQDYGSSNFQDLIKKFNLQFDMKKYLLSNILKKYLFFINFSKYFYNKKLIVIINK